MKRTQNQSKIIVKDAKGKTAVSEGEQIPVITEYFKKMLAPESAKDNYMQYEPKEMRQPFTREEIKDAAKNPKEWEK